MELARPRSRTKSYMVSRKTTTVAAELVADIRR